MGKAVLGVDFGNLNFRMAGLDGLGVPRIIPNKEREDFTPTVLLFGEAEPVLGKVALAERALRPKDVVMGFKPFMGTDEVLFERDGRKYTACDLYAEVLKISKAQAEKVMGQTIEYVTITVPEQWGSAQRKHVEVAGKKAGIQVKEMPGEAQAAAVGYGLKKPNTIVLVFDKGSSTTDVSIVQISGSESKPKYRILATEGDGVGGRDIDALVMTDVLNFLKKKGLEPKLDDLTFEALLGERAQLLKETLSDLQSKTILVECNGTRITYSLNRAQLEAMAKEPLSRMMALPAKALASAGLTWETIRYIVAVGGGSKMPAIMQRLKQFGPEVKQDVDPDRATVYGAALIGGSAGGYSIEGKLLPPSHLEVQGVTSMDLSLLALDGKSGATHAITLVPANTPIPGSGEERFDLVSAEQTKAEIIVVEGKHGAPPQQCRELDKFVIEGLPKDSKRGGRIQVKFEVSNKGIANVTVLDSVSQKEFKRTLKYSNEGGA
jgi:molecular chaperone DnaK